MSTPVRFHPLGTQAPGGESLERVADIDPRLTRTHFFDGRLLTAALPIFDGSAPAQRDLLLEFVDILRAGVPTSRGMTYDVICYNHREEKR